MADSHLVTIGSSFLDDTFSVTCSCGFHADGLNNQQDAAHVADEHTDDPEADRD